MAEADNNGTFASISSYIKVLDNLKPGGSARSQRDYPPECCVCSVPLGKKRKGKGN